MTLKSAQASIEPSEDSKAEAEDVTKWVEEYGDRLFRYALYRVRNRELAEDLVQDALLSAYRSLNSFEGRSSVYTWLITILKNKIIDHVRKDSRATTISLDDGFQDERGELFNRIGLWNVELLEWDGGVEKLLERRDFRKQLDTCLGKMPEKLRQAFVFKTMDGMSSEDICDVMKISSNNLWVMLYRARMRLRNCLDTNWFEKQGGV
jgi:RNA polymerase sigma-70 factor (ECF subfamily)